jgi:hypothetical protein
MNNRRQSEIQLIDSIEEATGDLSVMLHKQTESRVKSLDLLQKSQACGHLVSVRSLIEELRRNRTEND